MRTGPVLWLLLAGFQPTLTPAAQDIVLPGEPIQPILKQWADRETVEKWTQAIRAGRRALAENRPDDAATFFRQAILACEGKAAEDIHQCIPRLLLAEVLLETGRVEEAKVQVDQLVSSLKKGTRYLDLGGPGASGNVSVEMVTNGYRYQVGGALYLRAARVYRRLGTPRLAEPLFALAIRVFGQRTHKHLVFVTGEKKGDQGLAIRFPLYPQQHLRVAEIFEARCRFHLLEGNDELALKSLTEGGRARKSPPIDSGGQPLPQTEMFLDQLVAEPLDKSFLRRFLEDCAFYRFDDARIADLLDRQAVLLRKVSRNDEATAFERFAESLRKKPLNPKGLSHLDGGPIFD